MLCDMQYSAFPRFTIVLHCLSNPRFNAGLDLAFDHPMQDSVPGELESFHASKVPSLWRMAQGACQIFSVVPSLSRLSTPTPCLEKGGREDKLKNVEKFLQDNQGCPFDSLFRTALLDPD